MEEKIIDVAEELNRNALEKIKLAIGVERSLNRVERDLLSHLDHHLQLLIHLILLWPDQMLNYSSRIPFDESLRTLKPIQTGTRLLVDELRSAKLIPADIINIQELYNHNVADYQLSPVTGQTLWGLGIASIRWFNERLFHFGNFPDVEAPFHFTKYDFKLGGNSSVLLKINGSGNLVKRIKTVLIGNENFSFILFDGRNEVNKIELAILNQLFLDIQYFFASFASIQIESVTQSDLFELSIIIDLNRDHTPLNFLFPSAELIEFYLDYNKVIFLNLFEELFQGHNRLMALVQSQPLNRLETYIPKYLNEALDHIQSAWSKANIIFDEL